MLKGLLGLKAEYLNFLAMLQIFWLVFGTILENFSRYHILSYTLTGTNFLLV